MSVSQSELAVVIGGTGFIGTSLTRLLIAAGCPVRVVSRRGGAGRQAGGGVEYVAAAVADQAAMSKCIEGAAVVYHLAMGGGETWADYQRDFVDAALHIAESCRAQGVRRLVYTSSISALYMGRKGRLDESMGRDPHPERRSFYSRGKIEAERVLLDFHRRTGFPVVIVRPAVVVGPGGNLSHGAVGAPVSDLCFLGYGNGRTPLPFVLVSDVAKAMVAAKDAPGVEGHAFNLVGDVRPSAREYVRIVAERSLRNFRFYPRSLLLTEAGELARGALKKLAGKAGASAITYRDLKSLAMKADFDCSAAKRMLGWQPVDSMETFVREAIDCHLQPVAPGDLRLETQN